MLARREDSKLFHKLVRSQRGNSRAPLPQLDVKDVTFRGEDNIRAGWKTHFQTLASASSNHKGEKSLTSKYGLVPESPHILHFEKPTFTNFITSLIFKIS